MKLTRLAVSIVFALLVAGCIKPSVSSILPSDFEATYSYGACHAEWGRTNIVITTKGGVYEQGSGPLVGGQFSQEDFRKEFKLSESELLALLNGIEQSGFFGLEDYYSDTSVMDGSCSYISVTRNGETKSVSVSNNGEPEAYAKAAEIISAAAQNKAA